MGTIKDGWYCGVPYAIKRQSLGHLCAYVGIPWWHPLAGIEYDDCPLDVHGGCTFSEWGDGDYLPKGFFWYGWDYAHFMDMKNGVSMADMPMVQDNALDACKELAALKRSFIFRALWLRVSAPFRSYMWRYHAARDIRNAWERIAAWPRAWWRDWNFERWARKMGGPLPPE